MHTTNLLNSVMTRGMLALAATAAAYTRGKAAKTPSDRGGVQGRGRR
jgi:hypothetical protein